ncbi:hypothetical protein V8D89_000260 [Ganoderma adspersum]
MRFLDTETGRFVRGDPKTTKHAILSHTWNTEKGEQTYEELRKIQQRYGLGLELHAPQSRPGDPKGSTSSSSDRNRGGPPPPLGDSHPPDSSSTSATTLPPTSLRLTSSAQTNTQVSVHVPPNESSNDPPVPGSWDIPSAGEHQTQSIFELDVPGLFPKIRNACAVARKNGYRYIWIDSCCIDKSSSSELSEAINSMYQWYGLADVCYAYLADVSPEESHHTEGSLFRKSRWFTRGWTLQELIAPDSVVFVSSDWTFIGSKQTLVNLIESITRINSKALLKLEPLDTFSVAQRLSWAANRETTRKEDSAYSLLGIFGINMATLYGEGNRAFQRLQEKIMRRIPDQSLFAWGELHVHSLLPPDPDPPRARHPPTLRAGPPWEPLRSPFAESPADFKDNGNIRHAPLPAFHHHEIEYTSTPYGIRTQFQMIPLTRDLLSRALLQWEVESSADNSGWYLAVLGCEPTEQPGHLLGRVCYMPPSKSRVEFMYTGYLDVPSQQGDRDEESSRYPYLLFLSPETIKQLRPHTKLKTVYMSHPNRADLPLNYAIRRQPYIGIALVLSTETGDALRSRGYSTNLRDPDPDNPDTHYLTLSKDGEHTITVKFHHTLQDGGRRFTINAEVAISTPPHAQSDSAPESGPQLDRFSVSWTDSSAPWETELGHKRVWFVVGGAGSLIVDLKLVFAGNGIYILRVDVPQRGTPPESPAVDELTEERKGSGAFRRGILAFWRNIIGVPSRRGPQTT